MLTIIANHGQNVGSSPIVGQNVGSCSIVDRVWEEAMFTDRGLKGWMLT